MYLTTLCRIMLFVFVLNVLTSQTGFSQSLSSRVEAQAKSAEELAKQDESFHKEKLTKIMEQYDLATSPAEMMAATKALHAEQMRFETNQKSLKNTQDLVQDANQPYIAQPDGIAETVASVNQNMRIQKQQMNYNYERMQNSAAVSDFLNKIKKGELDLEGLIEYLDPIESTRSADLVTAYAAEIIANTLDSYLMSDEGKQALAEIDNIEYFNGILMRTQARAAYRLGVLKSASETEDVILARGDVRFLIYKLHKFYPELAQANSHFSAEDPFTSKDQPSTYDVFPTQSSFQSYQAKCAKYNREVRAHNQQARANANKPRLEIEDPSFYTIQQTMSCVKTYDKYKKQFGQFGLSKKAKDQLMRDFKNKYGQKWCDTNLKVNENPTEPLDQFVDFMGDFMAEVRAEKNKDNPAYLKLKLEYATRYAVMTGNTQALNTLISMFEDKVGVLGTDYTDFATDNSAHLNTIMGVIYETLAGGTWLKGTNTSAYNIIDLLIEKTSKAHPINTRVLALEALSFLNLERTPSFDPESQAHSVVNIQNYRLDQAHRDALARRTASISHTLTGSMYHTYGLDSDQMAALADQLALIYERFLPVMGPATVLVDKVTQKPTTGQEPWTKAYVADTSKKVQITKIINWNEDQVWDSRISNPQATFVYDESGYAIDMNVGCNKNHKKVDEENGWKFFGLVGDALLWIYGGEIFSLGFRAFGLARGAIAALPRAIRAANVVNKGSKIGRFTAKIRQGMRLTSAGMNATLDAAGVTIAGATRMEEVTQTAVAGEKINGALLIPEKAGQAAPKITVPSPVTRAGTSYVFGPSAQKGTTGFWGRLWNKMTGNVPEIESYELFAHRPGFTFAQGTVNMVGDLSSPLARARFLRGVQGAGIDLTSMGGYAAKQAVSMENTFMAATTQALKMDATATGLATGKFEYWAYKAGKWERVSQEEFYKIGKTLESAKGTASAAGLDISKDYYKILGVSRDASAKEIKLAYRKLATKLHPDRHMATATEAEVAAYNAQLEAVNEAYDVLGTATKKAAYDAAIGSGSVTTVETSAEGFSLAIRPNMGASVPEGFNPITGTTPNGSEGIPGLGFNASNISSDVSVQVTDYLVQTKQVGTLGDLLVSNMPSYQYFQGNLKFFGAWAGLDYATYHAPYFGLKDYMTSTATEETQAEMAKHGDAYDPDLLAQETKEAPQGPTVGDALNAVNGAKMDDSSGALIVLPYIAIKQNLSEQGIGTTPFMTDDTRALLSVQAKRIQLYRALREQQKNQAIKNDQDLATYYQQLLANIEEARTQWTSTFAQLKKNQPGLDFSTEQGQIIKLCNEYTKEAKAIMKGSEDVMAKYKALNSLVETNQKKFEGFETTVTSKIEDSQYNTLVEQITQAKVGWTQGVDASTAKEITKLFDNALAQAKKIRNQKGDLEAKCAKYEALANDLAGKLESFKNTLTSQSTGMVSSFDDLISMHSFVVQYYGAMYGSDFVTQLNEVLNECIATCKTSTGAYDTSKLESAVQLYNQKATSLLEKYARKPSTASSDDMDELLPDSETTTSAAY